jgi:hypothetical protein
MPFGIGNNESSLEELQETQEKLQVKAKNADLELTVAQKQYALQKLREAGLSKSSVGGTWSSVKSWLKGKGLW